MSSIADKLKKSSSAISGVTARYIRLTGFKRSASVGPMISQFALYSDSDFTDLIIGQNNNSNPTIPELTASVTPYSSWSPNKAGSASTTSGWYLGNRTASLILNDWIQYDLGSPTKIGGIRVWNGYATNSSNYWVTEFTVEYSNDGTNWTLIRTVTNTSGGTLNTIDATPVPPPPEPVVLANLSVAQGSTIAYTAAYYGFASWRNPDDGTVSTASLTINGNSYYIRELYRRIGRTGGVDNAATTSSFFFGLDAASDGSLPADDWFSSISIETSGDPIVFTPDDATTWTNGSAYKEWRFFPDDFTSAQSTALTAEWNGSNTSTVTIMV